MILRYGDWAKAAMISRTMSGKFQKAATQAMLAEGQFLRGKLVQGITSGAPGGKAYAPLSDMTLAIRRFRGAKGTKPMMRTGTFRNSIVVERIGGKGAGGGIFVGVSRGARTGDGKSMVNLAELHEYGKSWTQRLSSKARRFLFAALRASGMTGRQGPRLPGGQFTSGQAGGGYVKITIPARPTFQPVFEMYAKPEDVAERFWTRVAKGMGYDLGRP